MRSIVLFYLTMVHTNAFQAWQFNMFTGNPTTLSNENYLSAIFSWTRVESGSADTLLVWNWQWFQQPSQQNLTWTILHNPICNKVLRSQNLQLLQSAVTEHGLHGTPKAGPSPAQSTQRYAPQDSVAHSASAKPQSMQPPRPSANSWRGRVQVQSLPGGWIAAIATTVGSASLMTVDNHEWLWSTTQQPTIP